ncbi:unnamed protein product [Adineta steineri]|uniref:Uncharacterized protein n=2 Tax=Adineta steineri TaxID=433720 RepID=A0A814ZMZ6_9BILA|nr:unnamed protein product [Adineta steineri]
MTLEKSDKIDSEKIITLLNEAQKLIVQVRPSSIVNNSIDITAVDNNKDDDRIDPLRVPEIIIVLCVLALWFGSILLFIRHSELLRIRHRDLPYRLSAKAPMNLNHITVVNRTSDMVIHSKPRLSGTGSYTTPVYNHTMDEYSNSNTTSPSYPHTTRKGRPRGSTISIMSTTKYPYPPNNDQFLNPYMISTDVRRSLLDLHRKSIDNLSAMRYSISFSTNDVSRRKESEEQNMLLDERCIQESPV